MPDAPTLRPDWLDAAWTRAGRALADAHDVVLGRVDSGEPPAWCVSRGWEPFLSALSDVATQTAERDGLSALASHPDAPPSLLAFARDVADASRVPELVNAPAAGDASASAIVRAPARKSAQVAAFVTACAPLARACERVVDVGSGHGHLTRHLADAFDRAALGLERDPRRVAVATDLARRGAAAGEAPRASFVTVDVVSDGLPLRAGDLAVGLHACGELGDLVVNAALRVGASVALVACCLQKTRAPAWHPRACPAGVTPERLTWPREVLGLSNLVARAEGVEASLQSNLRARENRHAIAWLLRARGVALAPGQELAGVNRRRAHAPLAAFAAWVFAARGLSPPTAAELAGAADAAAASYARARRYTLARSALGRLVEVFVLCDRARALAAAGYDVAPGVLFPDAVSPRNLALLGRPPAQTR